MGLEEMSIDELMNQLCTEYYAHRVCMYEPSRTERIKSYREEIKRRVGDILPVEKNTP